MYLVHHFQRIQSLLHEIKSHSKAEGSTFFDTMRLSAFFRLCETDFFPKFFYCSSHQILIFCNRMDVQKIPKRPHFYIFRHYATYRKLQKKFGIFFLFFILRAFVVSSCRKSGFRFRVFLSLRYGAVPGLLSLTWLATIDVTRGKHPINTPFAIQVREKAHSSE